MARIACNGPHHKASETLRGWLTQLTAFHPAPGAGAVALRAGAALGVPLAVLVAVGATDLTLYATFGAFAAVYGRVATRATRICMQAQAGVWLTFCVTFGAAIGSLPGRDWWVIPSAAVVAAGGSVLSSLGGWTPPGPLFAVFAVAACASIRTPAGRIGQAAAVAAAAAALAVVVGLVGRAVAAGPAGAGVERSLRRAIHADNVVDAGRHAGAVGVAGVLPTAVGWGHPYWAMVAAVAVTAGSDRQRRVLRGVQRIAGTLVGVTVAAAVLAPHPPTPVVVVVVVAAQVLTELTVGRNYALALVFVTPLAILMAELGRSQDPGLLLRDRAVETVIGGVLGISVSMVGRRTRTDFAQGTSQG